MALPRACSGARVKYIAPEQAFRVASVMMVLRWFAVAMRKSKFPGSNNLKYK